MQIPELLKPPVKPAHLSPSIQWLAGEGCGSWFHIERKQDLFLIKRYTPSGKLECAGMFTQESGAAFTEQSDYKFTFLSHCAEVTIIQNDQKLHFKLLNKI